MCDVQEGAIAPIDGLPGKRRQGYNQYSGNPMQPGGRGNIMNSGHMNDAPYRNPPPPQGHNQGYGIDPRVRFNQAEGQYPLQNSSGREDKRPIMRQPPPRVIHQSHHAPPSRGPHSDSNSRIEFRRASGQAEPPLAQTPIHAPHSVVSNSQAIMPPETRVQQSGAQETLTAGHDHPKTTDYDFNYKTLQIVVPIQGQGTYSSFIQAKNGIVHIKGVHIKRLLRDELNNKRNIKDFGQENFDIDLKNAFIVKAEAGAIDNKYLKPFYPTISLGEKYSDNDESSYFFNKKRLTTSEGDKAFSVPYAFRIPAEFTGNEKILIREREVYANDPYVLLHHGETSNKLKQYLDTNSVNTVKYDRIGVDVKSLLYTFVSTDQNITWCERAFLEQGKKCNSIPIFDDHNGITYAYYDTSFLTKAILTYSESRNMILSVKDLTDGIFVKFNTFSSSSALVPTYDVVDCKTSVQEGTLELSRGVVYFELHLTLRIPFGIKLGQTNQEVETAAQRFMRCINSSGKFFDEDLTQST